MALENPLIEGEGLMESNGAVIIELDGTISPN